MLPGSVAKAQTEEATPFYENPPLRRIKLWHVSKNIESFKQK